MENLRSLNLKSSYETGADSLLKDFYIPALSRAHSYDRAVGYFSSNLLIHAAEGISKLIACGGTMRLIIGDPLSDEEYQAVKATENITGKCEELKKKITDILESDENIIGSHRLQLLTYLILNGSLEIRFAFRKKGIYHKKIGIITDKSGDKIAFRGSANETLAAMDIDTNAEEVTIYPSWKHESYEDYGAPLEAEFHNLWERGQHHNTITIPVPSAWYTDMATAAAKRGKPDLDFEAKIAKQQYFDIQKLYNENLNIPVIPEFLGGQKFLIKEHQVGALNKWQANSYQGILKLATGSGKTITAIYGMVKLYNSHSRLAVVVAVPYIGLAEQWVKELALFGIAPHKCFESKKGWLNRLKTDIQAYTSGAKNFLAIVVVNKTLVGSTFRDLISRLPSEDLLFVGDECHRHGSQKTFDALPNADLRMGLSATPFRDDDDEIDTPCPNENKVRLIKYYGDIVDTYTLADAINDGVLTPYEYFICSVRLTIDEQEIYEELSKKIRNILSNSGVIHKDALSMLCGQRSRLLGGAENKLAKLNELVAELPSESRNHSLFYCAEGSTDNNCKHINLVSKILHKNGWRTSQFTAGENSMERAGLLAAFADENIDSLVSMKVLDEGIDIPACRSAFILASTRNPRQYVQRRGRILRKSAGKTIAKIYDFVIFPAIGAEDTSAGKNLVKAELERINDFMLLASNKSEAHKTLDKMGIR
jgi:superfamily II DNA or RNA helicase